MIETKETRKRIFTFLGLTFVLSAVINFFIFRAGSMEAYGGALVLLLMWMPGLSALITTLIYQRNLRGLGWGFGKPRFLLIAYLLPLIYGLVVYGFTWVSGLGAFTTENLQGQPLPVFLATTPTLLFLLGAVPGALGEEIGWRGFLVPHLAKVTGFSGTAIISGLIWAVWHSPLLLFSDYNSGTPVAYAFACFTVMVLGISFAFTWLTLRSKSVWPAVILHASHNLFIQAIFDVMTRDTGPTRWITGEFGIGLALAGAATGAFFWYLEKRSRGNT